MKWLYNHNNHSLLNFFFVANYKSQFYFKLIVYLFVGKGKTVCYTENNGKRKVI